MGGLGNQLFQLFTTLAYGIRHNRLCIFPYKKQIDAKRHGYWDSFLKPLYQYTTMNSNWNMSNEELFKNIPVYSEPHFHYTEIPKIDCTFYFYGYFQSFQYFEKEKETIFYLIQLENQRKMVKEEYATYFTPLRIEDAQPEHLLSLNSAHGVGVLNDKRCNNMENTIYISVHFRLSDYLLLPDHHPILSVEYYRKAIDYILSFINTDKCIKFLYFCEKNDNHTVLQSIESLKRTFKQEPISFVKVGDDIPDWKQVLMMSNCHHNIIANSTFSWWGAYFNLNPDKMICYPSIWFGTQFADKNTKDLCPSSWKKIEI